MAPYTYSVDGSAFTATLVYNNLAAGTHTVEVTDANGCIYATTATVGNISGTAAVTIYASATSICTGGSYSQQRLLTVVLRRHIVGRSMELRYRAKQQRHLLQPHLTIMMWSL